MKRTRLPGRRQTKRFALLLFVVGSIVSIARSAELDANWMFAPPSLELGDAGVVSVASSDGHHLARHRTCRSPIEGVTLEYEAPAGEEEKGSVRLRNEGAAGNNTGVFLRIQDDPALTGHAGGAKGFESLRLSVRVKLAALDRPQSLVRKTEGSTENGYLLAINSSGHVRFAVGHWGGKGSVTTGTFKLETERWYQIEGVWDGEALRILVDGSHRGHTTLFSGRLTDTSGPLAFGALERGENNTGQFLDGWLSDISIQGFLRKQPKKEKTITETPDTTAWGTPVKRMWFCPLHNWGQPALGIPMAKGVRHAPIFEPEYEEGAYNHHPEIIFHGDRFYAMWSNNMIGEDRAGQRILYSVTGDVSKWPSAELLFPQPGEFFDHRAPAAKGEKERTGFYMTAMKFIPLAGRLFAVATLDSTRRRVTPLVRELLPDGSLGEIFAIRSGFTREEDAHLPFPFVRPDEEPCKALAARLLDLYLTPKYLPSWNFGIEDLFPRPCMVEGAPMCEWSIHRAKDGKHVMLARDLRHSHRMYAGVSSKPDPNSFSPLSPTDIPDSPSKAVTLNLNDGTVLLIGNQLAREFDNVDRPTHCERDPLTVSISKDGYRFERQLVLRWEGGRRWRTDRKLISGRGAGCQYPAAMIHEETLYVIYSIGKEDVAVSWVELSRLRSVESELRNNK